MPFFRVETVVEQRRDYFVVADDEAGAKAKVEAAVETGDITHSKEINDDEEEQWRLKVWWKHYGRADERARTIDVTALTADELAFEIAA